MSSVSSCVNTIGFLLKETGDKILGRYLIIILSKAQTVTQDSYIPNYKQRIGFERAVEFFSFITVQQCKDDKHPLTRLLTTNL